MYRQFSRSFMSRAALAISLLTLLGLSLAVFEPSTIQAADPAQLLYVRDNNLVVVNGDGSGTRTIYTGKFLSAQWSPDGSKVAVSSDQGAYVINADGSNPRKLTSGAINPNWSPDSSRVMLTTLDGKLIVINADGSNTKTISNLRIDTKGGFWSPDSTQILFAVNPNPLDATTNLFRRDLYLVNSDGSNLRKLYSFGGTLMGFWFDGKQIVYNEIPEDAASTLCIPGRLAIRNLDGSGKQNFGDEDCFEIQLSLAPTNDRVLINTELKKSSVVSLADPVQSYRTLAGVDSASWSNKPGNIFALTNPQKTGQTVTYNLEEINLESGVRRQISQTPPLRIFEGVPASVFGLQAEATSNYANFTNTGNNSYLVNLNTGQISDLGNAIPVGWRPVASKGSTNGNNANCGNILPDFCQVWKQSDLAVATGQSNRSWLWGPDAFATKTEEYKEAKGGQRQVQYFDKARMEINNPDGDRSSLYFVTNGLLPKELIGGYLQIGDNQSQPKAPAEVNVAGDPDGSITYAKLQGVVTLEPGKNTTSNRVGQAVTSRIDRSGTVSEGSALPGVTLAQYISETGHNIPNVFVNYFKTLPQDWVFVMGFPISEPYITEITLSGKPTTAIIQVYERRVLTYTPSNSEAFRVEQGNVGQHYYKWRYGG